MNHYRVMCNRYESEYMLAHMIYILEQLKAAHSPCVNPALTLIVQVPS